MNNYPNPASHILCACRGECTLHCVWCGLRVTLMWTDLDQGTDMRAVSPTAPASLAEVRACVAKRPEKRSLWS